MCWVTHESLKQQIAKKDIKVYKVFKVEDGTIYSPIHSNQVWSKGATVESPIKISSVFPFHQISLGLHSCIKPIMLDSNMWCIKGTEHTLFGKDKNEIVLKCIIPKGTTYYVNKRGEVVSNKLKLL